MPVPRRLRVFVYRNLHNGKFSVRGVAGGRVLAHADSLLLHDAVFRVSEAGRRRALREGRRNVHAGVEGDLVLDPAAPTGHLTLRVRYSPYVSAAFLTDTGRQVNAAPAVLFRGGQVYIQDRW